MESLCLPEYRCLCNKLLFRGALFDSSIEIKCKRCGRVLVINGMSGSHDMHGRYTFVLDIKGTILEVSDSVVHVLGYKAVDLLGKNFCTICSPCFHEQGTQYTDLFTKVTQFLTKAQLVSKKRFSH